MITGYTNSYEYESKVYYDREYGYIGTDYPIGTSMKPVNNLRDALIIAAKRGIKIDDKLKGIIRSEKLKRILE